MKLLAAELRRAASYDFRALLREIVLSEAYGRAAGGGSDDAEKVFARAAVRPLPPETLFRSLVVAAGLEEAAAKRLSPEEIQKKLEQGLKQFVFVFGDDEMGEVDRGSRHRAAGAAAVQRRGDEPRRPRDPRRRPPRHPRRVEGPGASSRGDVRRRLRPRADGRGARARSSPSSHAPESYEDLFFAMLTSSEFTCTH